MDDNIEKTIKEQVPTKEDLTDRPAMHAAPKKPIGVGLAAQFLQKCAKKRQNRLAKRFRK